MMMSNSVFETEKGMRIELLSEGSCKMYVTNPSKEYNGVDNNIMILDFGKRKKGESLSCQMRLDLKNTDLVVTGVGASCGCTRPVYTPDPDNKGCYILTVNFDGNRITQSVDKYLWYTLNGNKYKLKFNIIINKTDWNV